MKGIAASPVARMRPSSNLALDPVHDAFRADVDSESGRLPRYRNFDLLLPAATSGEVVLIEPNCQSRVAHLGAFQKPPLEFPSGGCVSAGMAEKQAPACCAAT